jgi:hypothetical protein
VPATLARREYVDCDGSIRDIYKEYVEQQTNADRNEWLSLAVWFNLLKKERPFLRTARRKQDLCTACFKVEVALRRPGISQEEKEELELQRTNHRADAVAQRREMNAQINASIEQYRAAVAEGDPAPAEQACAEELESEEESVDEEHEADEAPAAPVRRRTLVQCEDFGQSVALPHYGRRRPGVDYFLRSRARESCPPHAVKPYAASLRHVRHNTQGVDGDAVRRADGGEGGQCDCVIAMVLLPASPR